VTSDAIGIPILITLLGLSGACAATPNSGQENTMEYLQNLKRLEDDGSPIEAGSKHERTAITRFQALLSDFKDPQFKEKIEDVYASKVFFNDTIKTVRSSTALVDYLAASADALETGTVEFLDVVNSDGNYYFRWQMTLRFKKLARDRDTVTVGMSHIRFNADGRVVLHQDFWDSSSGLFEHIPGLGWMIRSVKRRL
jgi:hypothetical protein